MADDVIDKADSLMRRHRAFVAAEPSAPVESPADAPPAIAPAAAVPPLPNASVETEAEDIPVLTEVVTAIHEAIAPSPSDSRDIEALLRERLAAAMPQQRELLRQELALWLDEQLPQLIMRVLDGVTDQLVAQVGTQARTTLLPRLQAALDADIGAPPAD